MAWLVVPVVRVTRSSQTPRTTSPPLTEGIQSMTMLDRMRRHKSWLKWSLGWWC